jgi:putative transposase
MTTPASTNHYKPHRFPGEIIRHGVWLYFWFCLSSRDVAALLVARGVHGTYEAIRKWCHKCGQASANQRRRRRPRPGDTGPLDAVLRTINRARHSLWRAVDQDDNGLDILGQRRRATKAATKFFRKLLKGCQYVPRVLVTDKLKSLAAAEREIRPGGSIANSGTATSAPSTLPSRRTSGTSAGSGANLQGTPNGFSPPLGPSPNTAVRAGIA